MNFLAVFVGAAFGALVRYGLTKIPALTRTREDGLQPLIPWPTFIANILACFLLGIVARLLASSTEMWGQTLLALLGVGFCGALSTMSTLALELINLVRSGSFVRALGYILLTLGACLASFWLALEVLQ